MFGLHPGIIVHGSFQPAHGSGSVPGTSLLCEFMRVVMACKQNGQGKQMWSTVMVFDCRAFINVSC